MTLAPATVSVVVCVYTEERWDDIAAAVTSVRAQSLAPRETLLVVDHNPALHTRLTTTYAHTPTVRVLANSGPRGLSSGRNTGIAASTGEIIAFLDDDAVAERDWLLHLVGPYADPRVLAVGGRTEPAWDTGRRPSWFPEEFDWVVGCMYRGHPRGQVPVRNVLGGNASFRRTAFETVGGFATGIGRDGTSLPLGCEETELCIRLRRAHPEAVLLMDDRALIHHRVPAARARLAYLATRAYAEGLSKARVSRLVGTTDALSTERAYTTRVLPQALLRNLLDTLRGDPTAAARAATILLGTTTAATGYTQGTLAPTPTREPHKRRAGGNPMGGEDPFWRGASEGRSPSLPGRRGQRGKGRSPILKARGLQTTAPPVPILMYHAITATPNKATKTLSVTPKAFTEQMELLQQKNFTPLTTTELTTAWRQATPLPPHPVLITFDDGYEGVHTHALPTLTTHNFPATLFLSTNWLHDSGAPTPTQALDTTLTWDQVRELAAAGLEIGGHSHTHPQLDQLTDPALTTEIATCRDLITEHTHTHPASFAYPYGYSSRRVREAVRAAGFAQSLAVNNALAKRTQSPYALTRLTVRRTTDLAEFERLIEGRALKRNFARDHMLGRGYAAIRRTRRAVTTGTRGSPAT